MGSAKVYSIPEKIYRIVMFFISTCMFAYIIVNMRRILAKMQAIPEQIEKDI